jgi:hypothetical protein
MGQGIMTQVIYGKVIDGNTERIYQLDAAGADIRPQCGLRYADYMQCGILLNLLVIQQTMAGQEHDDERGQDNMYNLSGFHRMQK